MENQVSQLRLNVKNIRSILVKSNNQLHGVSQRRNIVNKRILNDSKRAENEGNLEKKLKPKTISTSSSKKSIAPSSNPLDTLLNAGLILGGGVLINALPGLYKMFEDFKKEHKPIFDAIGGAFTVIYNGVSGIVNSLAGPENEKGAFDSFAKFGDDGKLLPAPQGGALSELKKVFDDLGPVMEKINEATKNPVIKALEDTGYIKKRSLMDRAKEYLTGAAPGQTADGQRGDHQGSGSTGSTQGGTRGITLPAGNGTTTPVSATPTGYNPGRKGNKNTMIYLHWTAGAYGGNGSYHTVFDSDGTPKRNASYDDYSVGHTEGKNSGAIGLSISAALGATGPNNLGSQPPTQQQLNAMTAEAARLAVDWGWTEADIDKNVWTHAEAGAGLDPRGLGTHLDLNKDGRPDNYGPKAWGGTGDRWDLWVIRQGEQAGSGGPALRNMIKQHFRRFTNRTLNPPSNTPHSGRQTHNPLGSQSSTINNRANSIASAGPLGVVTNTKIFVVGEVA